MAEEKTYRYEIHDAETARADGTAPTIDEEGQGTEATIEEVIKRHYPNVYFEEQPDGQILIFREQKEAKSAKNAVGKVKLIEN